MSRRYDEIFLFDIYVSILKIKNTVSKFKTAQELKYDYMAWDSIIRDFEIIGEATNILIKKELLPREYKSIVNLRNILIHHYFGIDADEIWDITQNDLIELENFILKQILKIDKDKKEIIVNSLLEEFSYLDFIVEDLKKLKTEKKC